MHLFLQHQPTCRIAIAGHTHLMRYDHLPAQGQLYLNLATWIIRLKPPLPATFSPEILSWLLQPDLTQAPLENQSAFLFAWIKAEDGQPATANLCSWEGGSAGNYQILC